MNPSVPDDLSHDASAVLPESQPQTRAQPTRTEPRQGASTASTKPGKSKLSPYKDAARVIRRIAKSMHGRFVTIRVANGDTVAGIVTDVLAKGGKPRVIVGGSEYLVTQILTVSPPDLPPTG